MSIEFIETGFEMKSLADNGKFEGYAAIFDNLDSHRDIMLAGSTTKSIVASDGIFPILADHWRDDHIGYNEKAIEDEIGLKVNGALNLEVRKAKEKYALAKQAMSLKKPFGLSIGYITKQASVDESTSIRKLVEVDIKEYSFVAFPSNTRASVLSIKSAMNELEGTFDEIKQSPKQLEGIFREVGFSVSESKKLATTAVGLGRLTNDKHLREVDEGEAKDVLESFKLMNAGLDMGLLNSKI